MERTESIVIEVKSSDENSKIQEMEMFGWSLQSRQEIHQEYLSPWLIGGGYDIKRKALNVKLHFARSLNLINIDKIKKIESEYYSLTFPKPPAFIYYILYSFLLLFGVIGLIGLLENLLRGTKNPINELLYQIGLGGFGGWKFYSIKEKRQIIPEVRKQNIRKREELISQMKSLINKLE
jgi:hypothetical protein